MGPGRSSFIKDTCSAKIPSLSRVAYLTCVNLFIPGNTGYQGHHTGTLITYQMHCRYVQYTRPHVARKLSGQMISPIKKMAVAAVARKIK